MTKRLIQQRRGKGGSRFRSPKHRFKGASRLRPFDEKERKSVITGTVKSLYHDPGKTAPFITVIFENKELVSYQAPLGIKVGDIVQSGAGAKLGLGNTLPLKKIPEGTNIYCVERRPGSGAKFVRAAGNGARVVAHETRGVVVQLPSKRRIVLNENCRAIIGKIAGGGAKEKPLIKAGKNYYKKKARGKKHPRVVGAAMNAVDHPHGGGGRRNKKRKSVSRHAPPGAKVGSISPKRTGKKK
jgi:large subunit ribosomal protein L2